MSKRINLSQANKLLAYEIEFRRTKKIKKLEKSTSLENAKEVHEN